MFTTFKAIFGIFTGCMRRFFKAYQIEKLPTPEKEQASLPYAHEILKRFLRPIGSRIVYHGLENLPEDQAFLMTPNHQSALDPFLIVPVMDRPTGIVAKKELSKIPLGARWMRNIGCLFIDRDDIRQSLQVIKDTAEKLKNGINMMIFPEGTRSRGGEAHEFKKGSLKAAFMAGAPVVPVLIDGSYKMLEANGKFRFTPAEVHIYFGKAIETASMSREEQKALAENIGEIIFGLKETVG